MRRASRFVKVLGSLLFTVAAGCAPEAREVETQASTKQALACALGGEFIAQETLTPASIPTLSEVDVAQIIAALHESAHTDVTTIQEAFSRVDEGLINRITLRDVHSNQFYTEIEFGAGGNSYGAIFYWGVAAQAAAIHDGTMEECGPVVFNYDPGDFSAECEGILNYLNAVTVEGLDVYLPSSVAAAIVDARNVHPFDSIASVMAVNGVGEARLQQIVSRTRAIEWIDASCNGVHDQIAVSATEAAAMVAYVNEVNAEELHGVLSFLINEAVVDTLIESRPFSNAAGIAAVSGVGPAVFRSLRNAATKERPFEELVGAVNAIDNHPDAQIRLDQHFDWRALLSDATDGASSTVCFGIAPSLLPPGAENRPVLANGNEVMENAGEAIALANAFGDLSIDSAAGLSDLDGRTVGRHFFGCYITYHQNPWVYDRKNFFVDTANGASLLITSHYVE
jgi:DNA uptake protein ComE-like DNA-binding protein